MSGYISDILYKKLCSPPAVTESFVGEIALLLPPPTLSPTQLANIASQVPMQDISGLVAKVTGKSLVADSEISKIHALNADNQDISGKVDTNDSRLSDARTPTTHNHDTSYNLKRLFANLAAPVVTSGTTEKVLLQLQIPANNAIVGSTYRAWIIGNSSSTGTLIFKVRCGAGGIITDAIGWTAVTSAAQAANARAGFDVLITIRSSTTLKAEGVGYAGAIQLPTFIAAPATSVIAISGIWYINLTVICSSGTFTAQVGNIEEIR